MSPRLLPPPAAPSLALPLASLPPQIELGLDPLARPAAAAAPVMYASGSNLPGEIRGLAQVDVPVGVAIERVMDRPAAMAALLGLAGTGAVVFADSGAFGEMRPAADAAARAAAAATGNAAGLVVATPITDAMWRRRLAAMQMLADALGPQLSVVAPDQVGNQTATLVRLRTYAAHVRALAAAGAQVLVALHGGSPDTGAMDRVAFFRACADAVGLPTAALVPALPMPKGALPPAAVPGLVARLAAETGARRVHLLGFGLTNPKADVVFPALAALAARGLPIAVSCDACLVAAHAGKANGKGGGPRALTAAADAFTDALAAEQWGDLDLAVPGERTLHFRYTDDITGAATHWLSPAARRRLVDDPFFPTPAQGGTPALRRLFLDDPTAALEAELAPEDADPDDEPETLAMFGYFHHALDEEWQRFVDGAAVQARKSAGVQAVFRGHAAAGRHRARVAPPAARATPPARRVGAPARPRRRGAPAALPLLATAD